ncbi:hypothetical protein AKO1_012348, partial [Acrasis kona]
MVEGTLKGGMLFKVYKQVADITEKVSNNKGSIQSLALSKTTEMKSVTFALCSEVQKYKSVIDHIIDESKFFSKNPKLKEDKPILRVIIYELLLGKNSESNESVKKLLGNYEKIKQNIFKQAKSYYSTWNSILVMLKIDKKAVSNEDLVEPTTTAEPIQIERFLRVNLLKTSIQDFLNTMTTEHNFIINKNKKEQREAGSKYLVKDEHINEIFVMYPHDAPVHNMPSVINSTCIVQDKASCMPAHVMFQTLPKLLQERNLNGNPVHIIDACAAPGNKTTHLAAKMSESDFGTKDLAVHAFDRDEKRIKILSDRVSEAGADSIVKVVHKDFSAVDPYDVQYKHVRAILLDPSCSGTGIVRQGGEKTVTQDRLNKLKNFQITLINHAMTFPNVECIVYSTCSIHEEENEQVVAEVAEKNSDLFRVEKCFPEWDYRGIDSASTNHVGPLCVRTTPEKHATNGFFVSCFVRIPGSQRERVTKSSHGPFKQPKVDKEINKEEEEEE